MMAAGKGIIAIQPSMEDQHLMRIKVNRVAIHQTLKVEHVIDYLMDKKVLDKNDVKTINSAGIHPFDRAKTLLTLVVNQKKIRNWYHHFVHALKNPETYDTDEKKKYQILVEFLDNTIITPAHRPKAEEKTKMSIPHYDLIPPIPNPSETPGSRGYNSRVGSRVTFNLGMTPDEEDERYISEDEENDSQLRKSRLQSEKKKSIDHQKVESVKKDVNGLDDILKIAGSIEIPVDHFKTLLNSKAPINVKQLALEVEVLGRTKDLLQLYGRLSDDTVFYREPTVLKIIHDWRNHHMYFKYLIPVLDQEKTNILHDITESFLQYVSGIERADNEAERNDLIFTGFSLSDFLLELGKFYQAERVIYCLVLYLETHPVLESWMGIWEAYIKIMAIRNSNLDMAGAQASRWAAATMANRIKLMSSENDLLDDADMLKETSTIMLERGSFGTAIAWAEDALKEVESDNHEGIVNCLCVAVQGYLATDTFKQAEQCAVFAVRLARNEFGSRHPLYVQALLSYSHFSTVCTGNRAANIQLAKKVLSIAKLVYGGPSLQVAAAHQAVALAMIENKDPEANDTGEALNHARAALKMARALTSGDHPRLALYQLIVGQTALTHYVSSENKNELHGQLHTAKSELEAALRELKSVSGHFSHHTIRATQILAQIQDALGEREKASSLHSEVYKLCLLSVDPRSLLSWRIKLEVAEAWFQHGLWDDAISLMGSVFKSIDTKGIYVKWLEQGYYHLIEILHDYGEPQEAEKYREWLNHWLQHTTGLETMPWEQLNSGSQTFEQFRNGIDAWTSRFPGKAKMGLLKIIKAQFRS